MSELVRARVVALTVQGPVLVEAIPINRRARVRKVFIDNADTATRTVEIGRIRLTATGVDPNTFTPVMAPIRVAAGSNNGPIEITSEEIESFTGGPVDTPVTEVWGIAVRLDATPGAPVTVHIEWVEG